MYFFLILLFSLIFPINSSAQTVTTTPTSDQNLTEEVRQMVVKKVQEIQQSDTKTSSISTTIPKSLFGTISKIDDTQITIIFENNSKTISTTTETVFYDAKKNKTKITNLKSGQVILAMGYYDESGNFGAKRIVVTSLDAIENKNEIIFGTIADISQTSNVLVLIPIKNKNTQYQIKTDSQTKVIDKNGTNLAINKLKSGQKVVVVIQPDAKIANTFDVSKIITFDSTSISPTPTPKK